MIDEIYLIQSFLILGLCERLNTEVTEKTKITTHNWSRDIFSYLIKYLGFCRLSTLDIYISILTVSVHLFAPNDDGISCYVGYVGSSSLNLPLLSNLHHSLHICEHVYIFFSIQHNIIRSTWLQKQTLFTVKEILSIHILNILNKLSIHIILYNG